MQDSNDHNHNKQRAKQYQPGEIEELDGWKWQCYCHDGPPSDWENDESKLACCMICNDVWGHVDCYGYKDVYERDKDLWNDLLFSCIGCSGADPTQQPSPYSQAPQSQSQSTSTEQPNPSISTTVH